jgi:hypothetical protein
MDTYDGCTTCSGDKSDVLERFPENLGAIGFKRLSRANAGDCLEKAGIIFIRADTSRRMGRGWT